MALLIFILGPTYANGEEEEITYVSVLKYYAGITSGFLIHEAGHAIVARITNTDMDWRWGDINQPFEFTDHASSDAKGAAINSAGFIFQATGGEIILRVDAINKNDAFVRGMMTWNVLNPVLYAVDYWFIHETNQKDGDLYKGDLQGIERYTNEAVANGFALGIVAVAVSQGYRFLRVQSWAPDWLKGRAQNVSFEPLHSGGFFMAYKFDF
jgi:hypothetical protein